MTQWGSKSLGDQGYSAIEILRYFYGSNMYINTAEAVSGIPASWPGYNIGIGSSGQNVYQIQKQLARIAKAYPAIPSIVPDGIYGPKTKAAVEKFQAVFGLPVSGVVDYNPIFDSWKDKNGYKPSKHGLCSRFLFRNDMCYIMIFLI